MYCYKRLGLRVLSGAPTTQTLVAQPPGVWSSKVAMSLVALQSRLRGFEQQIAVGAVDDGVLTVMGCEVFAKLAGSGYHSILSNCRFAALETRSLR